MNEEKAKECHRIIKLSRHDLKEAIILAMGYKKQRKDYGGGFLYHRGKSIRKFSEFPDWVNNINDAFTLEKRVPVSEREYYVEYLYFAINNYRERYEGLLDYYETSKDIWDLLHASASIRARVWLMWFLDMKANRPKRNKDGNK